MESRQDHVLIPEIIFAVLSGSIVLWRIYTNVLLKKFFRLADLLIFVALVCFLLALPSLRHAVTDLLKTCNLVALSCSSISVKYGLGKHIYDPSITPGDLVKSLRWIWIGEATNLLAMFFAKLSIASFLIYLDFATGYKVVMWLTVVLVILSNGGVAMVSIFASCRPVAMNWDMTLDGYCWPKTVNAICTYVQSGSNILTDLIFTSVPIFYLSTVKLGRNVQWGLRIVLLFGMIATICSCVKIAVAGRMFHTTDATWDAVDLTIWSTAEVNVCIIAACLPPLRNQFDSFLQRFLGRSLIRSSNKSRATYTHSIALQSNMKSRGTVVEENQDFSSERSILPVDYEDEDRIRKTIQVQVRDDEERQSAYSKYRFASH